MPNSIWALVLHCPVSQKTCFWLYITLITWAPFNLISLYSYIKWGSTCLLPTGTLSFQSLWKNLSCLRMSRLLPHLPLSCPKLSSNKIHLWNWVFLRVLDIVVPEHSCASGLTVCQRSLLKIEILGPHSSLLESFDAMDMCCRPRAYSNKLANSGSLAKLCDPEQVT